MAIDSIRVKQHPTLDARAFVTTFPTELGLLTVPASVTDLLSFKAVAPFVSSDRIRAEVRDLLRHGGFKPTGRSKPASEYLSRAAEEERLSSINLAVDVGNVVSLHSGLPISVVDLRRLTLPLHVALAEETQSYAFNPTGQVLELSGLLCLFDNQGPCASPVKDSQRTKTAPDSIRTLSLVWGTRELFGLAAAAMGWYRELLAAAGAETQLVPLEVVAN